MVQNIQEVNKAQEIKKAMTSKMSGIDRTGTEGLAPSCTKLFWF